MAAEKKPVANSETPKAEKVQTVKKAPPVATKSKKTVAPDPEESIESALNKAEKFIIDNGKALILIVVAMIFVVGGILAYKYVYQGGRGEKAAAMMFVAEQQFSGESIELALNGDGNNAGFLQVIENYGSTPQGNIAKHYAGECYMKLGEQDKALDYLLSFNHKKSVPGAIINAQNYGLQGDIYAQRGDYVKAASLYKQAVGVSDNPLTAPLYLKKEGLAYSKLGKSKEAIDTFRKIADLYPTSVEGRDINKYIGAEEQK